MRKFIVRLTVTCAMVTFYYLASAQDWTAVNESTIRTSGLREYIPERFQAYRVDYADVSSILDRAPAEQSRTPDRSDALLTLPRPDGTMDKFRVVQYQMMDERLAARFPDIKTYRGVHIDDPTVTVRLQVTALGFSAMVTGGQDGRYFVAPYARGEERYFMSYFKRDCIQHDQFECAVETTKSSRAFGQRLSGDCVFRSYRLAVAVTGEYSNFHSATSVSDVDTVLAAVVIAVNRVNEVYERDVAVRMILIDETTDVFYYNGATDPYSNGNVSAMLGQNQTNMTNVIGSANYDVGHVFGTGGGGVASLRVPCKTTSKARGVTCLGSPVDDPFYIDYVAHELGHQYGANHTQNNSCNRNSSTAMEPGSASTVMGYAGICSPNVQNNSDDYFHGVSILEINNYISFNTGNNCDVPIAWNNTTPVIASIPDYTIPRSTPFMLTADVSDAESDPIRYFWEQWDNEVGSMPPSPTNTVGPMFRSLDPTTSPTRYFPALEDVLAGTSTTWEVLPSVSRDMDFRITAIDFHNGLAGCSDEENVIVSTTASAGPFEVTSQNSPGVEWTAGEIVNITWAVANTNLAPVSCANVDIYLSCDGGLTFCDTLATATANDGSASVEVPSFSTEEARVMVKGSDNVFYNINEENISITSFSVTVLSLDTVEQICDPIVTPEAAFTFNIDGSLPEGELVSLAITELPPGTSAFLSNESPSIGQSVDLTVVKLESLPVGRYPVVVSATAIGELSTAIRFYIDIVDTAAVTGLMTPQDSALIDSLDPSFVWNSMYFAAQYELQVADDNMFATTVISQVVSDSTYQVVSDLIPSTDYYWRVRPISDCHVGPWSEVRYFRTREIVCVTLSNSNPVEIPGDQTGIYFSLLEFDQNLIIQDINIDVNINHTWVGDLRVTLSKAESEVDNTQLYNFLCEGADDLIVTFDDDGDAVTCPIPLNAVLTPTDPLADWIGQQAFGLYGLLIEDIFPEDGGTLNSWSIEVCGFVPDCTDQVVDLADSGSGTMRGSISCANDGGVVRVNALLAGDTIQLTSTIVLDKNLTIQGSGLGEYTTVIAPPGLPAFSIAEGISITMNRLRVVSHPDDNGGAIANSGSVTFESMVIGNESNAFVNNGEANFVGSNTVQD